MDKPRKSTPLAPGTTGSSRPLESFPEYSIADYFADAVEEAIKRKEEAAKRDRERGHKA